MNLMAPLGVSFWGSVIRPVVLGKLPNLQEIILALLKLQYRTRDFRMISCRYSRISGFLDSRCAAYYKGGT